MAIVTYVNSQPLAPCAHEPEHSLKSTVFSAVLADLDFQPKVRLLLFVQTQAQSAVDGWTAPLSFPTIADALRVDRKTVMRNLHNLLKHGYISRQSAGQIFRYRLQEQPGMEAAR